MSDDFQKFLELQYAKKVAQSESNRFIKRHYKKSFKDLEWYKNNKVLMQQHNRFINYIYSTFEKYIIHKNIVIYYFEDTLCSSSVLQKTVNISKTALNTIINDSKQEGWLDTRINQKNKRQTLIFPTKLRINFWLLYCRDIYEQRKLVGLDYAHKALYHYEENKKKHNKYLKEKI